MTNEVKDEKLDKALSEIDGLDNKDKFIFRIDSDTFRFKDAEYKLIEDYKEAFDIEMMEARFTDYLLKYDYIVGDIAYEKLRLRGFYEDHRKGVPIDMKISHLEDYLIEYCNFGCQYFVFERSEKRKADPESYFKRNKKQAPNKKANPKANSKANPKANPKNKRNNPKNRNTQKNPNNRSNQNNKKQTSTNETQKEFQVVKKQESTPKQTQPKVQNKPVKSKKTQNKKQFEIRKKTD